MIQDHNQAGSHEGHVSLIGWHCWAWLCVVTAVGIANTDVYKSTLSAYAAEMD